MNRKKTIDIILNSTDSLLLITLSYIVSKYLSGSIMWITLILLVIFAMIPLFKEWNKSSSILLLLLFFIFPFSSARSTTIHVTHNQLDTNAIKVYVVNNRLEADLIVYQTNDKIEAMNKSYVWYFSNDPLETGVNIIYVNNIEPHVLKIMFTNKKIEAGWINVNCSLRHKFLNF